MTCPRRIWFGVMLSCAMFAAMLPGRAMANQAAADLCLPVIAIAEQRAKIPAHLLRSIAYLESGRADPSSGRIVPWPWTINVGGRGYFYESKSEAIAAVQRFQADGIQSIDVGCAQINLQYHPRAFPSLESAFDVQSNIDYAARFLNALRVTTGSWVLAAANYHSATPHIGFAYARKVMAVWPDSARYGTLPAESIGATNSRVPLNYSIYTPQFAAALRRMDQRFAQGQPTGSITGLRWVSRPPAPIPLRSRPRTN